MTLRNTLARYSFLALGMVFYLLTPNQAYAEILYSQPSALGATTSASVPPGVQQISDVIGNFTIASTTLYLTFTMKISGADINNRAVFLYDQTDNVQCQTTYFTDAENTIAQDHEYHTYTKTTTQNPNPSTCASGPKNWVFRADAIPDNNFQNSTWKAEETNTHIYLSVSNIQNEGIGTRIDSVQPYDESTIATSSQLSLNAIGYFAAADAKRDAYIEWWVRQATAECSLFGIISCANLAGSLTTGRTFTQDAGVVTEDLAQSFDVSSTTLFAMDTPGLYLMRTRIMQPVPDLFGFIPMPPQIKATKDTNFIVGQTTSLDNILLAAQQAVVSTTTAANLSSCIPIPGYFAVGNCVTLLFVPTTRPDYSFGELANKPPFGYWTQMTALFQAASTTVAASTTPVGSDTVEGILEPLVTGLAAILWFLLALWIFHRLRHFNFHS